jgi:hypothetical protein
MFWTSSDRIDLVQSSVQAKEGNANRSYGGGENSVAFHDGDRWGITSAIWNDLSWTVAADSQQLLSGFMLSGFMWVAAESRITLTGLSGLLLKPT